MPLQQGKIKGIADVVFVLDASGSMEKVLEAVKKHIDDFVAGVNSSKNSSIDLRLGLVVHPTDDRPFSKSYDFTSDKDEFRRNLASVTLSNENEWTLPAIDKALDFSWRTQGRRFVAVFTDEAVDDGAEPEIQKSKLEDLKNKILALHVHGYFIAPPCPIYDMLGKQMPRMVRVILTQDELATYDFGKFLGDMGKTVSVTSESVAPVSFMPNLYGF
jgi:hypothetical protein